MCGSELATCHLQIRCSHSEPDNLWNIYNYTKLYIILYFREKQKQLKEEKKEKRKTQKGERRR